MNIFYLHNDPETCARYHADKHCVKMILESAQMLCTAHRYLDNSNDDILYKKTHLNHPCTVWVRSTDQNYLWLLSLLKNLCAEYTRRYGRIHKVEWYGLLAYLENIPKNIPKGNFFDPPQAMPDKYKQDDTVKAYRDYYCGDKAHLLQYKNTDIPDFIGQHHEG